MSHRWGWTQIFLDQNPEVPPPPLCPLPPGPPRPITSDPAAPSLPALSRDSESTYPTAASELPLCGLETLLVHVWACSAGTEGLSHCQNGQPVLDSLDYPVPMVTAKIRAIYYLGAEEDSRNKYRLDACSQIMHDFMRDLFPYLGFEDGFFSGHTHYTQTHTA